MRIIMDDNVIETITALLMDLQEKENADLPLYEQQLRETNTAIKNLLHAIEQGILTQSTKKRLEELEAAKEELEVKIDCEKLEKPKVSAEFITHWLHRFRDLDIQNKAHRQHLVDAFVQAIFLYDDKLVITFNYKEGEKTITLDEIDAAMERYKNGSDMECKLPPTKMLLSKGRSIFHFVHKSNGTGLEPA